jgi:hypothetical protein
MSNTQSEAYERLCWEPGFITFRFNSGKLSGGPYQANTWGRERDNAGITDLAVLVYGLYMIWFEIKQSGEAHRPSQIKFMNEVRDHGGIVMTIVTLDDLEKAIDMIQERFGK